VPALVNQLHNPLDKGDFNYYIYEVAKKLTALWHIQFPLYNKGIAVPTFTKQQKTKLTPLRPIQFPVYNTEIIIFKYTN
jgi:hypothetical protein